MAATANKRETSATVSRWLRSQAEKKKLGLVLHTRHSRRDGQYLYLPTYVDVKSAWGFAQALQDLEDSWNHAKPRHKTRLVLVPSADDID